MRFLLDHHVSPQVGPAFARLGGRGPVTAMRDWHGGSYVAQHGESDLPWLRIAGREAWIIVHNDRNTLLRDLALLALEGAELPGFAVIDQEHLADIGWIARRLVELERRCAGEKPANIQLFL
jgi:hypothetical protein